MKAASAAFFTGEKEVVMDKKRIWVAVGVVENPDGKVFICRRTDGQHQAGKWEFPGGKVESGEGMPAALIRELAEEIGIEAQLCEPLLQIEHDYPDKSVLLDVWRVTAFEGEPYGREGQAALWVERDALLNYEFPEANQPITRKVMGL
jgi:8-oxo-dGTP diphosphatase